MMKIVPVAPEEFDDELIPTRRPIDLEARPSKNNQAIILTLTCPWPIWRCSAPGSLDTSLSHAAGLIEIAACHA